MNKFFVIILFISLPFAANAQGLWGSVYNGPGDSTDVGQGVAIDNSGNVYVTGYSYGIGTDYDYITIKYDGSSGDTLWTRRYNKSGASYECAYAIAVDKLGNPCVTGISAGSGYLTIKYNSLGDTCWLREYSLEGGGGGASVIITDTTGNIYVTGMDWMSGQNQNYSTIKYNSSGTLMWTMSYDGTLGNGWDAAHSITVDGTGNVYVTGESEGNGTGKDYVTIKYKLYGDTCWTRRYNGSGNGDDCARSIRVDCFENVYVTGESQGSGTGKDLLTIKYNSEGDTCWTRRYNGAANNNDKGFALQVTPSGDAIYVTGQSYEDYFDCITIKYDSSGDTCWLRKYNGPMNSYDVAKAIELDSNGNVYVGGSSYYTSIGGLDYLVIKYSPSGEEMWSKGYNNPINTQDYGLSMALYGNDDIYVAGYSAKSGASPYEDFMTVRFSTSIGTEENPKTKIQNSGLNIYPNPVVSKGVIQYSIPVPSEVCMEICDVSGRVVQQLLDKQYSAGIYDLNLDADDLPAGIYFVKLRILENSGLTYKKTRKLILTK